MILHHGMLQIIFVLGTPAGVTECDS